MRRLQIHVLQPILSVSMYRGAFRDSLWSGALWWKYPLFVWQGSAFDDVDVYDHVVLVRIPLEAESAVDPSEVGMMLKACILSCQPFYRVCLCRATGLCYTCADWICFQRLVFWQSFELVFASFIDAFHKLRQLLWCSAYSVQDFLDLRIIISCRILCACLGSCHVQKSIRNGAKTIPHPIIICMEADFPWDGLGLGCGLLGDAPMGIRLLLSYVGSNDVQAALRSQLNTCSCPTRARVV